MLTKIQKWLTNLFNNNYPLLNYTDWFPTLASYTDKQNEASQSRKNYKFTLIGGGRGGGKSHFILWEAINLLLEHAKAGRKGLTVAVCCEDYSSLNDRQVVKATANFPSWLGSFRGLTEFRLYTKYGGGVIEFINLDKKLAPEKAYVGIFVDELTYITEETFSQLLKYLKGLGLANNELKFVASAKAQVDVNNWVAKLWLSKEFGSSHHFTKSQFNYVGSQPLIILI